MYAHIKGIVDEIALDKIIIDVSGIGYELSCSANTRKTLAVGNDAKLYTHFHISLSQDVMALYGFATEEERAVFRKLIGVNRIGPKLALAVLSHLLPEDVTMAVLTENAAAFDKVPGMGKKTAARLLLELKEKFVGEGAISAKNSEATTAGSDFRSEAVAALVALGYDGVTAGRAVAAVGECTRVEDMITKALKELAKRG